MENRNRQQGCVCQKVTDLLSRNAFLEEENRRVNEENARLRRELGRVRRTAKENPFGRSTPSSKQLVKPSAKPPADQAEARRKMGGAKSGHEGHGWKELDLEVEDHPLETPTQCPDCGGELEAAPFEGKDERDVVELRPVKAYVRRYRRQVMKCTRCGRIVRARIPGVLDSCRYGNSVIAGAATDFFLHGMTAGTVERRNGVSKATLLGSFNRVAKILEPVRDRLFSLVRSSPLAQGDETVWRTDGGNGYAWVFIAGHVVAFVCADTRGSRIAKEALGEFGGIFVSDRYNGYEFIPGQRAFCLEHLKRDALKILDENPDSGECRQYVEAVVPILKSIMHLRVLFKGDEGGYRREAVRLGAQLYEVTHVEARHPEIQKHQDIFRDARLRTWQWLMCSEVPAENNRSEREVRPLTLARKNSHGSQSERGAETRGVFMSILHTLKACGVDPRMRLQQALDRYAENPNIDLFDALFHNVDFAIPRLPRRALRKLPKAVTASSGIKATAS